MKSLILFSLFLHLLRGNIYAQTGTPCPGTPTITYGGQTYNTVQIGNQCWLKENLNIGTRIDGVTAADNNGIIEKYYYNNDTAIGRIYGGLYTWNEAMQYVTTAGAQGICPTGWHIPTNAEFQTLSTAVGGDGNKLKAVGQGREGGAGTDLAGYSALLTGIRDYDGSFAQFSYNTYFWSSSEESSVYVYEMDLNYIYHNIELYYYVKAEGFCVRCIKDEATVINNQSKNSNVPNSPELSQNFPNPFNPSTVIRFELPVSFNVTLKVFDVFGNEVGSLVDEIKPAGTYNVTFNGSKLSSGVYYYRLKAGNFFETKKLIIAK